MAKTLHYAGSSLLSLVLTAKSGKNEEARKIEYQIIDVSPPTNHGYFNLACLHSSEFFMTKSNTCLDRLFVIGSSLCQNISLS